MSSQLDGGLQPAVGGGPRKCTCEPTSAAAARCSAGGGPPCPSGTPSGRTAGVHWWRCSRPPTGLGEGGHRAASESTSSGCAVTIRTRRTRRQGTRRRSGVAQSTLSSASGVHHQIARRGSFENISTMGIRSPSRRWITSTSTVGSTGSGSPPRPPCRPGGTSGAVEIRPCGSRAGPVDHCIDGFDVQPRCGHVRATNTGSLPLEKSDSAVPGCWRRSHGWRGAQPSFSRFSTSGRRPAWCGRRRGLLLGRAMAAAPYLVHLVHLNERCS